MGSYQSVLRGVNYLGILGGTFRRETQEKIRFDSGDSGTHSSASVLNKLRLQLSQHTQNRLNSSPSSGPTAIQVISTVGLVSVSPHTSHT